MQQNVCDNDVATGGDTFISIIGEATLRINPINYSQGKLGGLV